MAESNLATDDPGERYATLELAYTEDRWPDVLEQGESLIADLSTTSDALESGLLSRAQLLLGHAHLYGLRNPTAALPYYRAVLAGPAEPDLQQIAEAALPYCQPATASEESEPRPEDRLSGPEQDTGLSLGKGEGQDPAASVFPAAEESLTTAPTPSEPEPTPTPNSEPWSTAITPPSEPSREPGSLLGQVSQPGDPFQVSLAEAVRAQSAAPLETVITESATPWLDDLARKRDEESLRAQRANGLQTAGNQAGRVEVELVEEPEQLEVAQADPLLAEELNLEMASNRAEKAAAEELDRLMQDPELVAGLLRVVLTP